MKTSEALENLYDKPVLANFGGFSNPQGGVFLTSDILLLNFLVEILCSTDPDFTEA